MVMARDARSVDSRQETPIFFPVAGETLFGIFTRPIGEPVGAAVIALPGGGTPLSTNRNRLSVRLCRRLAADGCHAMRFDYHGVGESTGALEGFRLDEPFVDDVVGVTRWIERQEVNRFILVGSCFGARTALSAASAIQEVEGVVLICVAIRDFEMGERTSTRRAREWSIWQYCLRGLHPSVLRGLLHRRRRRIYVQLLRMKQRALWDRLRKKLGTRGPVDTDWLAPISGEFMASLKSVLERGVPVLFVYGTADDFYEEFRRASAGELGRILALGRDRIEVMTLPGRLHGFMSVDGQDEVMELVIDWIRRHIGCSDPESE